ncbi:MAG TPA: ABC transporter permease [Bacteroidales bacterium]|nr:ABC transporter permease [Bacteroidales bacterium]
MFKNLLWHSARSFKRQFSYVIINILGLSIGIACSLFIALYIINESTYDRFNEKRDRIFRTVLDGKISGQQVTVFASPAVMGPTLLKEFPEVEDYCRTSGVGPTVVDYNNKTFTDDDCIEVDSSFFNIFSVKILRGDPQNLLNGPHKAVLSESTAKRIFGNEDPLDKQIKVGTDTTRYIVSGVMEDMPEKSHFEASILLSFMTNPRSQSPIWMNNSFGTYLLLKPNTSYKDVDAKFHDLLVKYVGPEIEKYMGISMDDFEKQGNQYRFYLQNIKDIHLDPSIQQQFKSAVDPKYLQIFGAVGLLIVLIAAINFMNLATAQATRRAKEVGIKKVGGSTRGMLILQFLSETIMLTLVSLILAVILVKACLPWLGALLGVNISLGLLSAWYTTPVLILFAVLVGILAGSYPAFYLSSFNPVVVLKGKTRTGSRNGTLRRILVVFQFAVSILLIIGTMIMYRQINFMINKDVGFDKNNLLVIERAHAVGQKMKAFKDEVRLIPGVVNISSSTAVPGRTNNTNGYGIEGRSDESFILSTSWVDYDFIDTYGIKLASGRFFDNSFSSDSVACLINQSAINNFSISNPAETRIVDPTDENNRFRPVIGVMENFNFESLRNPVNPYILKVQDKNFLWGYISIRLKPEDRASTIASIEKVWNDFVPNTPLQYYFIDEDFKKMYIQEKQNAQMAVLFSILAIFIATLGLFGLTSYTVEQRTKEIGVRKAMGCTIGGICVEISKEIVTLVLISALIAWPLVYYWAGKWLMNFHFRIDPGILSFVVGMLLALGVALATISFRVIKAARINPSQSLKYE